MSTKYTLPPITEEEKSPLVIQLLEIIAQQAEEIQQLKDEIARLKNHPGRPRIKPSRLGQSKDKDSEQGDKAKRPGSAKRSKTAELEIHETRRIAPEQIPAGSIYRGFTEYTVQDICIEPYNTRYELEHWETPEGESLVGELPDSVKGGHFGAALVSFVLYQYYHGHVTQPLLLEQLWEYGIDISAGQLSRLLIEDKESFHQEKEEILATGLQVSSYIQVDDTGARHQGRNGYCTQIGNDWFAWFESTGSKSRLNFFRLLRAGRGECVLSGEALAYMEEQGLAKRWLAVLREFAGMVFLNEDGWQEFLAIVEMVKEHHVRIATEGVVLGGVIEHGIANDLMVLSDGAGQFNVLLHGLCWIHAERSLDKLILVTDKEREALEGIRDGLWDLYEELKKYKAAPNAEHKVEIEQQFDELFNTCTCSEALNKVLQRLHRHKSELLLVLKHPELPLHNNGSEQAIREYVKRRKISGGTRSEAGRRSRDTFTSLKKTCRKLGLSFWCYLMDRNEKKAEIPPLSDLIRQRALELDPG